MQRDIITKVYLHHVLHEGKAMVTKTRQRKLYNNGKTENWYVDKMTMWRHVIFEHPSSVIQLQEG